MNQTKRVKQELTMKSQETCFFKSCTLIKLSTYLTGFEILNYNYSTLEITSRIKIAILFNSNF